jgi:hypothetical protein
MIISLSQAYITYQEKRSSLRAHKVKKISSWSKTTKYHWSEARISSCTTGNNGMVSSSATEIWHCSRNRTNKFHYVFSSLINGIS